MTDGTNPGSTGENSSIIGNPQSGSVRGRVIYPDGSEATGVEAKLFDGPGTSQTANWANPVDESSANPLFELSGIDPSRDSPYLLVLRETTLTQKSKNPGDGGWFKTLPVPADIRDLGTVILDRELLFRPHLVERQFGNNKLGLGTVSMWRELGDNRANAFFVELAISRAVLEDDNAGWDFIGNTFQRGLFSIAVPEQDAYIDYGAGQVLGDRKVRRYRATDDARYLRGFHPLRTNIPAFEAAVPFDVLYSAYNPAETGLREDIKTVLEFAMGIAGLSGSPLVTAVSLAMSFVELVIEMNDDAQRDIHAEVGTDVSVPENLNLQDIPRAGIDGGAIGMVFEVPVGFNVDELLPIGARALWDVPRGESRALFRHEVTKPPGYPAETPDNKSSSILTDWPMFQRDPTNTGFFSSVSGPTAGVDVDWTFEANNRVATPPTVSGGVVYIGDNGNNVYAIDASDGSQVWSSSFQSSGPIDTSAPAIRNDTVYVGSFDGRLYALDRESGTEKWQFDTGDAIEAPPTVRDGTVYAGSSTLFAIEASSGRKLWEASSYGGISVAPAATAETVYVTTDSADVLALNSSDGSSRWFTEVDNLGKSSPTVVDEVVYAGGYAIDSKTGDVIWEFGTDRGESSPAVTDDTVFIGALDGHLYALDRKAGTEIWRFQLDDPLLTSPAVTADTVFIGASGAVHAVEAATGDLRWTVPVNAHVTSPAVTNDSVYVGSSDELYAILG